MPSGISPEAFFLRWIPEAEYAPSDTFRLLPYLFDHDELREAVSQKVFLGFSDTTINHFMLHKVDFSIRAVYHRQNE